MSNPDATRQDFLDWVSANEGQAMQIEGTAKWQRWASWPLFSRMHEREYNMWKASGDTQQLRNSIRFSAGLPGVGTGKDDFTGAKKRLGDQYRAYLGIAQNVVTMAQQELADLQAQLAAAKDPNLQAVLNTEITLQQSTIVAEQNNVNTWQKTLNDAIASGQAA